MKIWIIVFFLGLPWNLVWAETFSETFLDHNYSLCEGVGGNSTGVIKIRVEFERSGSSANVNSLSVLGNYANVRENLAGKVRYRDSSGRDVSITLTKPWYNTIVEPNTSQLVLPRVATSSAKNIQDETMSFTTSDGKFRVDLTGYLEAGCAFTFAQDIRL